MWDVKEIEIVKAVDFVLEVPSPLPTGPGPALSRDRGRGRQAILLPEGRGEE